MSLLIVVCKKFSKGWGQAEQSCEVLLLPQQCFYHQDHFYFSAAAGLKVDGLEEGENVLSVDDGGDDADGEDDL